MRSQIITSIAMKEMAVGDGTPLPGLPVRVHVIGDLHFRTTTSETYIPARMMEFKTDVLGGMSVPDYRVSIGDITEYAANAEVALAQELFTDLELGTGVPIKAVAGNHDYYNGRNSTDFTNAYGNAPNWFEDVGSWLRLIGVSPHILHNPNPGIIDLDFLSMASNTPRVCVVFCHYPLNNTVLPSSEPNSKSSLNPFYYAHTLSALNGLMINRPSIKAWISGHTHSPLDAVDLLKEHSIAGRTVATVNTSAIAHVPARPVHISQALCSPVLTIHHNKIVVQFRNHKTGGFEPVDGEIITTLNFT